MSQLWLGAALPIVTGALIACVGVLVARRPTRAESRLASGMFALWWFGAAVVLLLTGLRPLLYLAGVRDASVYQGISYALAAPLAAGLCGLLFYLVYIYTGRRALLAPLVVAYALFFVFELFYFASIGPRTLEETTWTVRLASADPPAPWLRALFGVLVAAPILGAVVAYASLLARVHEREQRFRIAFVSTALAVWFAPLLVAFLVGGDDAAWFPLVYQAPGVPASIMMLVAFRPPKWARSRRPADGAIPGARP